MAGPEGDDRDRRQAGICRMGIHVDEAIFTPLPHLLGRRGSGRRGTGDWHRFAGLQMLRGARHRYQQMCDRLLKPVLADILAPTAAGESRPWLGVFSASRAVSRGDERRRRRTRRKDIQSGDSQRNGGDQWRAPTSTANSGARPRRRRICYAHSTGSPRTLVGSTADARRFAKQPLQ